MIAGLRALQDDIAFEFEVIDVDSDRALGARFGAYVPVLAADEVELCHYHLDVAKVNEYLGKIR